MKIFDIFVGTVVISGR